MEITPSIEAQARKEIQIEKDEEARNKEADKVFKAKWQLLLSDATTDDERRAVRLKLLNFYLDMSRPCDETGRLISRHVAVSMSYELLDLEAPDVYGTEINHVRVNLMEELYLSGVDGAKYNEDQRNKWSPWNFLARIWFGQRQPQ